MNGNFTKVWLDDERPEPAGWHRVYTASQAIELLNRSVVEEISLDNDLGDECMEGYDVIKHIEYLVFHNPEFRVPKIYIHTANPVARQKMHACLRSIEKMRQGLGHE